jgi:hypothetical protein
MSETEEKTVPTQGEPAPENVENMVFGAKKHLAGAATWFICALIILPCYIVTHVWAMAVAIPFLLIIGAGLLKEGMHTSVRLSENSLEIRNATGFRLVESKISMGEIKAIKMATSKEQKEESIQSLELLLGDKKILLPDLDNKVELLNCLKRANPKIKIEKVA